ncbi:MAG: chromate transporter [bacterium]
MKLLLKLYLTFMKLGVTNFGGGYALLPLLEKEIVEKNEWATKEEITDYYAVGQCTPGVISVNVSTFIGYKLKGIIGGIVSTLGFVTPSIIIIILIATVMQNFMEYEVVQHAFNGINICVVILILKAVITMFKKNVMDTYTLLMYITVLVLTVLGIVSPFISVIICGVLGVVINILFLKGREA